MADKKPTHDSLGETSAPYCISACPNLLTHHLGLFELTLNQLLVFRDLYQGMRERQQIKVVAERMGIPRKKCHKILQIVDASLRGAGSAGGFLRRFQGAVDEERSSGVIFHEGVRKWLEQFLALLDDCQKGRQTLTIQGGDFSLIWLLPRV